MTLSSEPDAKMKLYLSESLTKAKSLIYRQLVNMKRQDRVWSIFSRNGIPAYKLTKDSRAAFIYTQQQMDNLLHSAPPPGAAGRRAAHGAGGGGAARGETGDRTSRGGGSRAMDVSMGRGGRDMDGSRRRDVSRGDHVVGERNAICGSGNVVASRGAVNADVRNPLTDGRVNVDVNRGDVNADINHGSVDAVMSHNSANVDARGGDSVKDTRLAATVTVPTEK